MRWLVLLLLFAGPLAAQAEIALERSGQSIADGGTDNVSNTGTSPFNLTYTISNSGGSSLGLTGTPLVAISDEDNCTVNVLSDPATPVTAAGSTTFILQVSPHSNAKFSFEVSIANDDANENPYNFLFEGHPSGDSTGSGDSGGGGGSGCSTGSLNAWEFCGLVFVAGLALLLRHLQAPLRD